MDEQISESDIRELIEFKEKIAEILQRPFCSTRGLIRYAEKDINFLRDSFFALKDALLKERMRSIPDGKGDKRTIAENQLSKELAFIFCVPDDY